MTETDCPALAEAGLAERYVAGRLTAEERERFEDHFVLCARCQAEIRLAATVRVALPRDAGASRRRAPWLAAAGLAAAAVAAGVLLLPRSGPPPSAGFGGVAQAPLYLGVPVRAEESRADSLFEAAMVRYLAEEYGLAAAGLEAALDAGVDSIPAEFFLAASRLMLGRDREAARGFGRVIAFGETPYLTEALLYRAKARLRLGDVAGALADLRRAAERGGTAGAHAAALADSVRTFEAPRDPAARGR